MLIETVTAELCSVVALQFPDASLQIQWKILPQMYFLVNLFLAMTSPSKYDQIPSGKLT